MATLVGNQSERSRFCLDQSDSRISPMWLIDVTNAHIWAWFYTWPHGIKNTRTQELNSHSWHSFNDRVEPGYKRDVCDALVPSRPWLYMFFNIENKGKKEIAFWRQESWGMHEAMAYNGWTLMVTMVWLNGSAYCPRFLKNRGRNH